MASTAASPALASSTWAAVTWPASSDAVKNPSSGVGVHGLAARVESGATVLYLSTSAASANALYLYSTRHGLLAIVGVIAAMYPAATVVLAFVRDRERVSVPQATGLGLAVAALVLVARG